MLLSVLLPVRCAVCDRAGPSPCEPCRVALVPSRPFAPPPGVESCRALIDYEGAGRELVARLKYRNARGSVGWLGDQLASLVADTPTGVVTWAPTSATRRRRRGYDQAELLARAVGRRLGRPTRALLVRAGEHPQTGMSRRDRLRGPRFQVLRTASWLGGVPVVLVDDVLTTGATLSAAARTLQAAGLGPVAAVVVARTPAGSPAGHRREPPAPR